MAQESSLGDRIKRYESQYTDDMFMPYLPIISRCDGRSFHTFCRGLTRPCDYRLSDLMIEVTRFLVTETNARCGYTQSDEITLVYYGEDWDSLFFSGRAFKMTSVIGSMATAYFNKLLPRYLPEKVSEMPVFDNRVFQVPNVIEACNALIWRELDATRNSVQMAARAYYSHDECLNKDNSDLQEMLHQKSVNWNDYPDKFKRGSYVRRKVKEMPFSTEEIDKLPPKHAARKTPLLTVSRKSIEVENLPPLHTIINREDVIFNGKEPETRKTI